MNMTFKGEEKRITMKNFKIIILLSFFLLFGLTNSYSQSDHDNCLKAIELANKSNFSNALIYIDKAL